MAPFVVVFSSGAPSPVSFASLPCPDWRTERSGTSISVQIRSRIRWDHQVVTSCEFVRGSR